MQYLPDFLPDFLVAYLIGSIPFGLLLVRLAGKGDIRRIGSGNIGATNVLRTGSKPLAALTLLLDGGKGFLAVYLAKQWLAGTDAVTYEHAIFWPALGVLCGHLFPIWLKFKGGKGVATTLGLYLALDWRIGIVACAIWLVIAVLLRYSSLAALISLLSAVALPAIWFFRALMHNNDAAAGHQFFLVFDTFILGAIVFIRHGANIRRLATGTEPKIGQKFATP